jgi:hypothetical protein
VPRAGPTFLIIGAMKAGTTALFRYLNAHPAVGRSRLKEPHYFDRHYEDGAAAYRRQFPPVTFALRVRAREGVRPQIGEASPDYLFFPHVPARVRAFDPGLKLIAVLRDPVDRAYSHYQHNRRKGREDGVTFEQAIELEPERVDAEWERCLADPSYWSDAVWRQSYLGKSRYAEQLQRWLEHFPRGQLHVVSSADLAAEPAAVVDECLRFLGLPPARTRSYEPENEAAYPPLDPATRDQLAAYFDEHNRRLYALLGRDFGWTRPRAAASA